MSRLAHGTAVLAPPRQAKGTTIRAPLGDYFAWTLTADLPCRDEDPELFFPGPGDSNSARVEQARAVCRRCPFTDRCLHDALATNSEGIFGGTLYSERKELYGVNGYRPADTRTLR